MADVSVSYKGAVIAQLGNSGVTTLKTGGTYCEGDVTVAYEKPAGEGTATADDIAFGKTAWVNGVQVEGAVPQRIYKGHIDTAVSGGGAYVVLAKDALLAEHKDDATLFVRVTFDLAPTPYSVVETWAINNETSFPMGTSALHQWMLRYDSNGSRTVNTGASAVNSSNMNGIGGVYITAEGELRVYSNSGNYAIRPSEYTAVVEW